MFMTRVLTGLLVGVLAATVAAADQQGSRPPQKSLPRTAQRGGPPGPRRRPAAGQVVAGRRRSIAELRLAPDQSARIEEIWQTVLHPR